MAWTDTLTNYAYDSRFWLDAMKDVDILPQLRGTLVRDGDLSYTRFKQCRHALCNTHLLRELVFVGESDPAQEAWTEPSSAAPIGVKEAAAAVAAGQCQLREELRCHTYLARCDRSFNSLITRRGVWVIARACNLSSILRCSSI